MGEDPKTLWETPWELVNSIAEVYPFALDVAASTLNRKAPTHYSIDDNALNQSWNVRGNVWCNPPYGKGVKLWIRKAHASDSRVVMLLQASLGTRWFRDEIWGKAQEVCYLTGRVQFSSPDGAARSSNMHESILVIFGPTANAEEHTAFSLWDWKKEPFKDRQYRG